MTSQILKSAGLFIKTQKSRYLENETFFFKDFGLVFLFIIRIRFPKGKSIADIIRSRYGETFVRKIRKLEKNDYKLRKERSSGSKVFTGM